MKASAAPDTSIPSLLTLPALLAASAKRSPGDVAVVDPVRGERVTYLELDARSTRIRDALVRRGVRPGDRVAVCAPKSIGAVTAVFGILKAAAAYVAADPAAPPARTIGNFDDCDISAAVVSEEFAANLQSLWRAPRLDALADERLVIASPGDRPDATSGARAPFPDDLAYLLYTSGSTGKPKGVIHTHRSALSFIDWCSGVFDPRPEDRFSSHAPFHFDLSIFDLFVCIKHGATLVLIGDDLGKHPVPLAEAIAGQRITIWYSTPSILRLLVEYGRMERFDYSHLRVVLFAGEVFPVKQLRALKDRWRGARYFNLYGPTETNVCTYAEIPDGIPADRNEPYPIGRACSDDRTMVADATNREVAAGAEGELYVAGGSVTQGYWKMPDKTDQAFFVDAAGTRWYKTGDIVKETPDEGYSFIGRRDRMVKRRGYRVELGEIEAALYRHPEITEAAVIAMPDEEQGVSIRAFLTASGTRPSTIELKSFCARNLPVYMIPDRFLFRDALPKTSTDKIDYQRLAEPQ